MAKIAVSIHRGIPENFRDEAVRLYDEAFWAKFSVAVKSKDKRIQLLNKGFDLEHALAATCDGKLVGLAGYCDANGSLTGGIDYSLLLQTFGFLRGNWAAAIFSLYERARNDGELLMDGIAVSSTMRGQGIGTRLLGELAEFASEKGYNEIRLDVIETNSKARSLYERNNFVATETNRFGYLRWLLGFGESTTLVRKLADC